MLLRLAVLMNRSRSPIDMPSVNLAVSAASMTLGFDADWLSSNPLTIADLEREQGYLGDTDYELNFS
jgi:exopolyphosphatase/guanosine-5'-triphosphate,3'-diphosphate pyrophosphatase